MTKYRDKNIVDAFLWEGRESIPAAREFLGEDFFCCHWNENLSIEITPPTRFLSVSKGEYVTKSAAHCYVKYSKKAFEEKFELIEE